MIVKSHEEMDHAAHLRKVFEQAEQCKMRFNPENKCKAFIEMPTPDSKKLIQTLNEMPTTL
ncbi:hypothetical protein A2U01_0105456, partial [Trifolium medium]|nr:hypothetical protein [Trifolium medium]